MDIGEVDLIICFDAQKSPIRVLYSEWVELAADVRAGLLLSLLKDERNA